MVRKEMMKEIDLKSQGLSVAEKEKMVEAMETTLTLCCSSETPSSASSSSSSPLTLKEMWIEDAMSNRETTPLIYSEKKEEQARRTIEKKWEEMCQPPLTTRSLW